LTMAAFTSDTAVTLPPWSVRMSAAHAPTLPKPCVCVWGGGARGDTKHRKQLSVLHLAPMVCQDVCCPRTHVTKALEGQGGRSTDTRRSLSVLCNPSIRSKRYEEGGSVQQQVVKHMASRHQCILQHHTASCSTNLTKMLTKSCCCATHLNDKGVVLNLALVHCPQHLAYRIHSASTCGRLTGCSNSRERGGGEKGVGGGASGDSCVGSEV
jgi:hypothetical protein